MNKKEFEEFDKKLLAYLRERDRPVAGDGMKLDGDKKYELIKYVRELCDKYFKQGYVERRL